MTAYVLECYDSFNAKDLPNELPFEYFCDQTTIPGYYGFLYDNNNNDDNTLGTPVDYFYLDTKEVGDGTVVPNAPNSDDYDE